MFKYIVLAASVAFASNASAACYTNYCKGPAVSTVLSVFPNGSGNIFLELPTDKTNLNCTLTEGAYGLLKSDHPLFKEIYSTILSAVSMNKLLQVRFIEGSAGCHVAYVRMWS